MFKLNRLIMCSFVILIVVSIILVVIIRNTKNNKLKIKAESMLEVIKKIMDLIIEAEKYVNYTGVEKKEYVLTKINQYAMENKMTLDNKVIDEKIEDYIYFSKNVNTNEKKSFMFPLKK